jgi:mitochondrial import receptor subunit TOM22
MFPEPVRDFTVSSVENTISLAGSLLSLSKTFVWCTASTLIVIILPILVESERSSFEQQQVEQQKQLLLGPGASSGGSGGNVGYGGMQSMSIGAS